MCPSRKPLELTKEELRNVKERLTVQLFRTDTKSDDMDMDEQQEIAQIAAFEHEELNCNLVCLS